MRWFIFLLWMIFRGECYQVTGMSRNLSIDWFRVESLLLAWYILGKNVLVCMFHPSINCHTNMVSLTHQQTSNSKKILFKKRLFKNNFNCSAFPWAVTKLDLEEEIISKKDSWQITNWLQVRVLVRYLESLHLSSNHKHVHLEFAKHRWTFHGHECS